MNTLFINGSFHSIDEPNVKKEAMWVVDGKIRALGSRCALREEAFRAKEVDLGGKWVGPSFTDSHVHLLGFGQSLDQLALEELSLEEVLDRVFQATQKTPPSEWIVGQGFNFNNWDRGFPQKEWLDAISPNHPVGLFARDWHMVWVNSKALEIMGVTRETPDPKGGIISRGPDQEPTGVMKEHAVSVLLDALPKETLEAREAFLGKAIKKAHSYGVTGVQNMEGAGSLRALQSLHQKGKLPFRVWATIPVDSLEHAKELGIAAGFGDRFLKVGGVKIFADGALGSRTASMLEPYEHSVDHGVQLFAKEELAKVVRTANENFLPVAVHAIGDRAVRIVLDAIGEGRKVGIRNRIEHAQLVSKEDIPRFSALGVVASMQPIHLPGDRKTAERIWGKRCERTFPCRELLDHGAVLAFGSDCPIETMDVLQGLYAAVMRKGIGEEESWQPHQALTPYEALRAYTWDAAFAASEEGYRGDLKEGYLADFVVLDQDILSGRGEILKETQVCATFLEGVCVYSR